MTVQIHTWENSLQSLAQEAWQSIPTVSEAISDESLLEQAYAHSKNITAIHNLSSRIKGRLG